MKVSELGEFGLIDLLAEMVAGSQNKETRQKLILGIGDDAAAWRGDTSTQLATVDCLIQDVHFSLDITPWHDLGGKALAVNLSDIAAMGGIPKYALVSLALPDNTEVEDVTALYQGMIELSQKFDVAIVGGDSSSAPLVIITITIFGSTTGQDKPVLTRSEAKVGEKVAVTGYLGTAAAGWEMLTRKLRFDPEATACLEEAFLRPYPRIAEGQLLVAQGITTAIDISDGLISDLNHICKASQVSARIEIERVPILPAVKASFGDRAQELALSGGEDYELLFTGSAETIEKVKATVSCPVTVIGEITVDKTNKTTIVDKRGNPVKIDKTGWEHFTTR
ncbi:Thiamine-monophosphate kinase [subsurface metagenome]